MVAGRGGWGMKEEAHLAQEFQLWLRGRRGGEWGMKEKVHLAQEF